MRSSRFVLLLLVVGLIVLTAFGQHGGPLPNAKVKAPPSYGDVRLYGEVAAEVRAGKNYYEVTTRLQRDHRYPVKPFYTVRPPLLAWANGWFGDLLWPGCLLLLLTSLAWLHRLGSRPVLERITALFMLLAAGLPLIFSPFRMLHDMWGGLFATGALGLAATRLAVIPATLAVLVRELNVPLLGLFALDRKSRSAALVALGLCAIALILHREAVLAWVRPDDPASQGWLGLRGPAGWVDDLSSNSVLQFLPRPFAALLAFAPLLGWVELRSWRALTWLLGVYVMVTVMARPDNTYWILNALPLWFVGLAFVPAFLWNLTKRPPHRLSR